MKKSTKNKGIVLLMVLVLALAGCQSPELQADPAQAPPVENAETATNTESATNTDEKSSEALSDKRDSITSNGMVASAHPLASKVGVEVLEKGGNAVDAAVAVGFALGVLEPNASGLGGGGFMMVRSAETGQTSFIDFRETLPADASIEKYSIDENGKVLHREDAIGPKSVAVPGEVAGLLYALENYGSLDRAEIMAPAIDFAQNGFEVSNTLSDIAQGKFDLILGNDAASKVFTAEGLPLMAGDLLVQTDLAKTLKKISNEGSDGFYKGEIAEQIINEIQEVADTFMNAGASDFALKPIKAPDLVSRIMVHLKFASLNKRKAKEQIEPQLEPVYRLYKKGISLNTLGVIESFFKSHQGEFTIDQISEETGLAYQTVHRYLKHFIQCQAVQTEYHYGKVGRPKQHFWWVLIVD